ncbi:MAG: hypothetical protein RL544_637 [Bacteroidota bacterium]|jgi:hypothetical protein
MKKLKFYLQKIYRLSVSFDKQEQLVWDDIKQIHLDAEWRHGVFEREKFIETNFEISDGRQALFYYMLYDSYFHCRVKILENFPIELTTDLFVLAAHFNNLLNNGVVVVNVNSSFIEYHQKRDLLIPLLYKGEIHGQITRHFNTARDIYSAFERLVEEQEAPAIIIADLLKKNDEEKTNEK